MKCIYCGCEESKVLDSRSTDESNSIRRRRECLNCGKRFTTYETVETVPILVIKKDGSRQPFNIEKIKCGMIKACEKRPVSMAQIDEMAEDIEKTIQNSLNQEVKSSEIGEMIMERLKKVDEIAYVRFASVYRQFKDVTNFIKLITEMWQNLALWRMWISHINNCKTKKVAVKFVKNRQSRREEVALPPWRRKLRFPWRAKPKVLRWGSLVLILYLINRKIKSIHHLRQPMAVFI